MLGSGAIWHQCAESIEQGQAPFSACPQLDNGLIILFLPKLERTCDIKVWLGPTPSAVPFSLEADPAAMEIPRVPVPVILVTVIVRVLPAPPDRAFWVERGIEGLFRDLAHYILAICRFVSLRSDFRVSDG